MLDVLTAPAVISQWSRQCLMWWWLIGPYWSLLFYLGLLFGSYVTL